MSEYEFVLLFLQANDEVKDQVCQLLVKNQQRSESEE